MLNNPSPSSPRALKPVLSGRQLNMIAIGGVIGAGLFVGSGTAISAAGPAVLLAYIGVGAVVFLIMRMLAELAVASPDSGSFARYATRAFGPWAGVTVSSLYTYSWVVVIGFEATAGAAIIHGFFPSVPPWAAALVFMITFTLTNLISARAFGEFEFWFALIKVVAICAFLTVGLLAIAGLLPGTQAPGLANLTGHGFTPHGWQPVWMACLVVFFSFFGAESVTIAAGEAKHPAAAVRRAMRSVIIRIMTFYVGSVAVVVTLLPSDDKSIANGPYGAVLAHIGIPHATAIVDVIVLTAVLSLLNSGIYASSRMMFAAAQRGELPATLGRVTERGVPVNAVLVASSGGFLTVVANYFFPTDTIFLFLLQSSGTIGVAVYLFIALTQIQTRRRMSKSAAQELPVRMWGFPYLPVFVVLVLLGIVAGLAFDEGSQRSLALSGLATAVALTAGVIRQLRNPAPPAQSPQTDPVPADPNLPSPPAATGA
ncbi:amino acid permease [Streptomyces coffeae]|uniref:Amino acid permease n=1 Tax=Streptomyces coffeae TaxID=621382 RepID=A0ABS1NPQ8_9ACTN|nr:amino acid permease [Streptomyces coffeae]MBL1102076.1 amino acid permease [Streptomyces coffeae]